MTLAELEVGCAARITAIGEASPVVLRLMEMGLVVGAPVQIRKRAPFGGPLELRVRDYLLTLRASEASRFRVQPDDRP